LVNLNGRILAANEAEVSVFDRGFLYGDSLYEVARSYGGVFFGLEEHLERLQKSAELCRMVLAQTHEEYRREIDRAFLAFRAQPGQAQADAYCRIIVTRGAGRIGFGLNCIETPTQYAIIMQPIAPFTSALTAEHFEKGLNLQISERVRNDPRALDPAAKTGNYLNSLLAYLDAVAQGYDDALMLNFDGHMTEGTTFNIFYVKRGIVATPPLDIGILDGITRRQTLELCRELGIPSREVRFPRERMYEADEVFASSSIKEVFPVTRLDGRKIGNGKPGPITRRLAQAMRERIAKLTAAGQRLTGAA
jgi:branched-chain amino acid aminotransferase